MVCSWAKAMLAGAEAAAKCMQIRAVDDPGKVKVRLTSRFCQLCTLSTCRQGRSNTPPDTFLL
jgi:hypothetical protein